MQVVRVKVIFTLPPRFGFGNDVDLAFVEVFSPFRKNTVAGVDLLRTDRARVTGGDPRTKVIFLSRLLHSCHLLPAFPQETPSDWTSENIFDVVDTFYLNEFLDDETFGTAHHD
jgi:hypothetical protein